MSAPLASAERHPLQSAAIRDALILLLTAVVMLIVLLHHPLAAPGDIAAVWSSLDAQADMDRLVHGLAVVLLCLQGLAFWNILAREAQSAWTRAGAIAFALAVVAFLLAALTDGFVIPQLAHRYAAAPAAMQESARLLLQLCVAQIRAASAAGSLGIAFAYVAWSMHWAAAGHRLAWLGVAFNALPLLLVATGHVVFDLHGMLLIVVMQCAWNVAVAFALLLRRL